MSVRALVISAWSAGRQSTHRAGAARDKKVRRRRLQCEQTATPAQKPTAVARAIVSQSWFAYREKLLIFYYSGKNIF
jgi:hypothetical protein